MFTSKLRCIKISRHPSHLSYEVIPSTKIPTRTPFALSRQRRKRKEFKNELNEFKQQSKKKKDLKAKLEQVDFEGKEDEKGDGEKFEDNNI